MNGSRADGPGVTVAVCTRDRPQELAACLASIMAVGPPVRQILVAVDGIDRATDDVVLAARAQDRRVELVRGPRIGLAANRNACIERARGDYVLYLDDDALLDRSFLEVALPVAGPDVVVTGSERRNGELVVPHDPSFLGFLDRPPRKAPRGIVINATLFPLEFLRRHGFDEFYRFGKEEADIALAAVVAGLRIVVVDASNEHLHVAHGRAGNDVAALRSRFHFSVVRYRRYEPSLVRLAAFLVVAPVHAALAGRDGRKRSLRRLLTLVAVEVRAIRPRARRAPARWPDDGAPPAVTSTVVVPTFRRPQQLEDCLQAIGHLDPLPDRVIAVCRPDDGESRAVIARHDLVHEVLVQRPGQVAAITAGVAAATTDVVVLTDDDTTPRVDWLRYLLAPYRDPDVVAVGGRDVVHHGDRIEPDHQGTVGEVHWSTKLLGNHHRGVGRARPAAFLKGANSSYRRALFHVPQGFRGKGSEIGNDLASSLAASARGVVVYDPRALVDHYPGVRHDDDRRVTVDEAPPKRAVADVAYNVNLALMGLRPQLRTRRLVYSSLVGDRGSVGVVRAVVALARGERHLAPLLLPCLGATVSAYLRARRGGPELLRPSAPVSATDPCPI